MGYRGKVDEQHRARDLRAQGWPYNDIAAELGVSKSSVSLWCRDVAIDEAAWAERAHANRNHGARNRRPNRLQLARIADIERGRREGALTIGELSHRDLMIAGVALYAGEGFKTGAAVGLANCDARMIALFLSWFRRFFATDEQRFRVRLYLHEGLDLEAATAFWSDLTQVPPSQFGKPYRAADDPTRRRSKHIYGCPSVRYSSASHLRSVLGLVDALLQSSVHIPG